MLKVDLTEGNDIVAENIMSEIDSALESAEPADAEDILTELKAQIELRIDTFQRTIYKRKK